MAHAPNGHAPTPAQAAPNSGDLAAAVVHDAQKLVGLEIALAKQEVKDLAVANAIAAGMVGAGGLFMVLAVLVAAPALVVVAVPWHWQAALVWLVAYALVGACLFLLGKTRFHIEIPARTLKSLKENKEWALRQMRSTVR